MIRANTRKGYVLLMVLLLLALSGLVVAQVTQRSLESALEAVRAQEDLQMRWGSYSCEQSILRLAPAIFAAKFSKETEKFTDEDLGPARYEASLTLGGMTFDLLLADENAKVNVNTIDIQQDPNQATSTITELVHASGSQARVRPRANRDFLGSHATQQKFESLGQILELAGEGSWNFSGEQILLASKNITCWGNGKLNFCRATESAIRSLCKSLLKEDEIVELLEARTKDPTRSPKKLMAPMGFSRHKLRAILRLLTNESSCFSLWVVGNQEKRSDFQLYVLDGGRNTSEKLTFLW